MKPHTDGPAPRFGMDHKAITWCHNLLSIVRKIVFAVTTTVGNQNDNQDDNDGQYEPAIAAALFESEERNDPPPSLVSPESSFADRSFIDPTWKVSLIAELL